MFAPDAISQLRDIFQKSSSFLILLKSQPTFDQVSSALSLLLALQAQKKEVNVVCSAPMRVEFGNLVGVDQIHQSIGNRSLQISFDYDEETVENVTYNLDQENKKFHLVIRPKRGHRPLDPNTVEYTHTGVDADTIFMIGVADYSEVAEFYEPEEQAFLQAHTISLHKVSTTFAELNLDGSDESTFSEMTAEILKNLELEIHSDIATNLLAGIEQATESFKHYSVTADTFEHVAELMRAGGRRTKVSAPVSPATTKSTTNLASAFAKQLEKTQVTELVSDKTADTTAKPQVQQLQRMQMPSDYTPPRR